MVELVERGVLAHEPVVQHGHCVGEHPGLEHVVRDQQQGRLQGGPQR